MEVRHPFRLPRILLVLSAVVASLVAAIPAISATNFSQGFEVNNVGWDLGGVQDNAVRVASGTHGITSKTGSFHGEVPGPYNLDVDGGSAFTRWGSYTTPFPPGGYTTSVDVYFDCAYASTAGDKRIDFTSAINDNTGSFHRDFVFNMGTEPTGFVMTAGNNAGRGSANPADPGHNPFHISTSGWYTLKHHFYNNAGVLACDLQLLDASNLVLHPWTLSTPSDLIAGIGGNRYGWFAAQELPFLAIDNTTRVTLTPADNVAPVTSGLCISHAHSCVNVPFVFARANATPARAISVDFTIDASKLALCGTVASSIHQGTWLGAFLTSFQVVDHGGGSYTVDQSILGMPCGVTVGGQVFTVDLKSNDGDGDAAVTVTAVTVRDCNNDPIPGFAGDPATVHIDNTNPTAIATLTAVQQNPSGHAGGSTTNVLVSWPAVEVEAGATVQVWRKGFGSYPEYSDVDGSGSVPAPPATPAAALSAGWTLTTLTAPGNDFTTARDYYYYVAFTTDGCGNVSSNSNETPGTLNYFLGDVSDGFTAGTGNNQVFTEDISLLGAHYGITGAAVFAFNYLDVGPTTNHHANGRPTPDDIIGFEDLVIFALNYNLVSKPAVAVPAAASDALSLGVDGLEATLQFQGTGRVQAVSTQLRWNPAVVEPVSFRSGDLLAQQGGVAFSPAAGSVDAALLGAGRGIRGTGALATVSFRRIAQGDAGISLLKVDARDTKNERVDVGQGAQPTAQLPAHTGLRAPAPNPSNGNTSLEYSLARGGSVELSIYRVDGRKVATLVSTSQDAGNYRAVWNGATSQGGHASPGVYFARLKTSQSTYTRMLTVIH